MSAGPRLTGPKLTAPAAKLLARSISSISSTSMARSTTLLTSSETVSPLSRKYADLLKEKGLDGDHPRHLYTGTAKGRTYPTPKKLRLMQTLSSSAPISTQSAKGTFDFTVLPSTAEPVADPYSNIRMPLMPDNYLTQYAPEEIEPVLKPEISVVAANPDLVSPSALTEVEGMTMDGVELKFVYEDSTPERETGLFSDMLKGFRDNLFGDNNGKPAV